MYKSNSKKWLPKCFLKTSKARKKNKQFYSDNSGSAAIEFAFIIPIFLALIFAIMEIAFLFFGNTSIKYATNEAARIVKTGRAQTGSFHNDPTNVTPLTRAEFVAKVCSNMFMTSNCTTKLKVDLRTYNNWSDVPTMNLPITGSGTFDASAINPTWVQPQSCKITVVRTFIERDILASLPGFGSHAGGIKNLSNGNLMQTGSAIFQTEPYLNACP